jgi:hypothetical protein
MLAVVGKLFFSVVNAHLQEFSKATRSVADKWGSFYHNRCTIDKIYSCMRRWQRARITAQLLTCANHIDARKVYDAAQCELANVSGSGVHGRSWLHLLQAISISASLCAPMYTMCACAMCDMRGSLCMRLCLCVPYPSDNTYGLPSSKGSGVTR